MSRLSRRFRSQADRWGGFANLGDAGAYSYPSQLVMLDSIESVHVQAVQNGAAPGRFKVLPLAAHEYTHWLDHVSTLWGRRTLLAYYSALIAREENNEHKFGPEIVQAWDMVRRIRSDVYYQVKGARISPGPWRVSLSCGVRFDTDGKPDETDPIPLVRLQDPEMDDERGLIVRAPLSVVAMTECTAQSAEYHWIESEAKALDGRTPADPRKWLDQLELTMFDPEQAIYTAVFHCLLDCAGLKSVEESMEYASALATLALNISSKGYSRLRSAPGLPDGWYERLGALRLWCDPGMALLVLLTHRISASGRGVVDWLEAVVAAAGLGSLTQMEAEWEVELDEQQREAGHPRLCAMLACGRSWANARGIVGSSEPLVNCLDGRSELPLPELVLGDGSTWCPSNRVLDHGDGLDAEKWFEEHDKHEQRMHEVLVACRRA